LNDVYYTRQKITAQEYLASLTIPQSMKPVFFPNASDFRQWFAKNHERKKELLVGFYKVGSGKASLTWSQSVDEALCFGWIDGVRKSIDKDSYSIRFTLRKPGSNWSAVNIRKVKELNQKGLMHPNGQASFEKRQAKRSKIYSYEKKQVSLPASHQRKFKKNKKARTFFCLQPPSYQRTALYWVMSAKQEITRENRLANLIQDSESGLKIKPLRYSAKNTNV
jgi:uncharacterized protein YdeI (YjbR/CyaY-like superfamily)